MASEMCVRCGRPRGTKRSCQFCGQIAGATSGVRIAPIGRRFGAYLLEIVLAIVTLGIGWLVWAIIVMAHGQTPAKQVLGIRVSLPDGRPAGWGRTFCREFLAKSLIGLLGVVSFGIIALVGLLWALWDSDNQTLYDKIAGTVIVDDREARVRAPSALAAS